MLSPDHSPSKATDILWILRSVRNWEQLTEECGWSQRQCIETTKALAKKFLLKEGSPQ